MCMECTTPGATDVLTVRDELMGLWTGVMSCNCQTVATLKITLVSCAAGGHK